MFDVPLIVYSVLVACMAAGIILRQETIDNAFRPINVSEMVYRYAAGIAVIYCANDASNRISQSM